jgi:hypothetical protein
MDLLRRLFGADAEPNEPVRTTSRRQELSPDEQAVERYRYLLRTAPPETIEEAHAEAFSRLTPDQRRIVLRELGQTLTPAERASAAAQDDNPRNLARLATRAEVRQPGTLERTWSAMPGIGGMGMGGFMMNNFLSTFAGVMLGSVVANAFLGDAGYGQGYADGVDAGGADTPDAGDATGADGADAGSFGDVGGDMGGYGDFGGGDFGGDF